MLYVEKAKRLLWMWLPAGKLPHENCALVPRPDGQPVILLGELNDSNTIGRLAFLRLEPAQLSGIEASLPPSLTVEPMEPASNRMKVTQGLEDYVHSDRPEPEILRYIAWCISSDFSDGTEFNLGQALRHRTFQDLLAAHATVVSEFIPRDSKLLDELRKTVEKRRIVFISGGVSSGLSVFLEQFKASVTGSELAADFDRSTFEEIYELFTRNPSFRGMIERKGGNSASASLFMSLAYVAYANLLQSLSGSSLQSLNRFIPASAAIVMDDFVNRYINEYLQHFQLAAESNRVPSQIECFLVFVGNMVSSAGRGQTLTVILSFPGLMTWLKKTRGVERADAIHRSLWKDLGTFAEVNYEALTGELKAHSPISSFKDKVAVLIETQWLAIPDIKEGFCKHCVLTLPPYSRDELIALWGHMTHEPAPDMLDSLDSYTGGAPWFVKLVLDCFTILDPRKSTAERLRLALDLAEKIVSCRETAHESDLENIKIRWSLYEKDLRARFSPEALTSRKALRELMEASRNFLKVGPESNASEWLDSGLIWLRHKQRPHTLRALETYPQIVTYPIPKLVNVFIEHLLKGGTVN